MSNIILYLVVVVFFFIAMFNPLTLKLANMRKAPPISHPQPPEKGTGNLEYNKMKSI